MRITDVGLFTSMSGQQCHPCPRCAENPCYRLVCTDVDSSYFNTTANVKSLVQCRAYTIAVSRWNYDQLMGTVRSIIQCRGCVRCVNS